jgi:hypothetical protein
MPLGETKSNQNILHFILHFPTIPIVTVALMQYNKDIEKEQTK